MQRRTAIALTLLLCGSACDERPDPVPQGDEASASALRETVAAAPERAPAGNIAASDTPPSRPAQAGPNLPANLRALGTEPFWNARIEGAGIVYTTPEDMAGQHGTLVRRDTADGAEFSGKLGAKAVHLQVIRRQCSDGMSDRAYPYTVVLTLGADRRDGCASAPK